MIQAAKMSEESHREGYVALGNPSEHSCEESDPAEEEPANCTSPAPSNAMSIGHRRKQRICRRTAVSAAGGLAVMWVFCGVAASIMIPRMKSNVVDNAAITIDEVRLYRWENAEDHYIRNSEGPTGLRVPLYLEASYSVPNFISAHVVGLQASIGWDMYEVGTISLDPHDVVSGVGRIRMNTTLEVENKAYVQTLAELLMNYAKVRTRWTGTIEKVVPRVFGHDLTSLAFHNTTFSKLVYLDGLGETGGCLKVGPLQNITKPDRDPDDPPPLPGSPIPLFTANITFENPSPFVIEDIGSFDVLLKQVDPTGGYYRSWMTLKDMAIPKRGTLFKAWITPTDNATSIPLDRQVLPNGGLTPSSFAIRGYTLHGDHPYWYELLKVSRWTIDFGAIGGPTCYANPHPRQKPQ